MNQIDNLSSDADQLTRFILDDGTEVDIELVYLPAVQRWMMNLTYGTRILNGLPVSAHPNLLRPWKDLIPFGLACVTTDGGDPVNLEDFTAARAALYVLSSDDVAAVESTIFAPAS